MSLGAYYIHKVEQCERMASEAADQRRRANLREEGKLWREIARDIAKQDRADPAVIALPIVFPTRL
jgi:hypothetical protein